MNLDRRSFTAMLAGTVARAALGLCAGRRHEVGVLFRRRAGAHALRGRSGCRDPDQARLGEDGRHHPVRVAASVAQISLRHREQRRARRLGRQRPLSRRLHHLAVGRARAAWRRRQAQVPADPLERRRRRRIRAGRLQLPVRDHGAPDQGRRHDRRHRRPARQPRDRHLFPPGPHHAAQQDGAGGRARQQPGGRQGRGSRARCTSTGSRTACSRTCTRSSRTAATATARAISTSTRPSRGSISRSSGRTSSSSTR